MIVARSCAVENPEVDCFLQSCSDAFLFFPSRALALSLLCALAQDAFDVMMMGTATILEIESMGWNLTNQVVFNGECYCYPNVTDQCKKQVAGCKLGLNQSDSSREVEGAHCFLNSGSVLGRAGVLEKLLAGLMEMIDANGGEWPTTDQVCLPV